MPLQTSGPISLGNIQTEFNGSNPISLSEYYKGGGYVPADNPNAIPTSGTISISPFYGAINVIEPTYPVGGYVWNKSVTAAYGNASFAPIIADTFTVPAYWREVQYTHRYTVTSTAAYTCLIYGWDIIKNGVYIVNYRSPANDSNYFRSNSGSLAYNTNILLKGGDVLEVYIYAGKRNTGGNSPDSTSTSYLQRTT